MTSFSDHTSESRRVSVTAAEVERVVRIVAIR
jgi:hypothetical protein